MSSSPNGSPSPLYADTLFEYYDSGEGPMDGPYGGIMPDTYPISISAEAVLGPDQEDQEDFLSLPTGSYVVVGFSQGSVLDGPGDDLLIQELGPGGETAEVLVNDENFSGPFFSIGIANDQTTTSFDLGAAGYDKPVKWVKIVGLDSLGASPGFDVVNVQGMVGSVNLAPVAIDDTATTTAGTPVVVDVLANDSDPDGDLLFLDIDPDAPTNGRITQNGDGTITYTPDAGFTGTDEFNYFLSDPWIAASLPGTVSVTVNAPHEDEGDTYNIYRFYNTETGTHFYTANEAEMQHVRDNLPIYNYEGIAFNSGATSETGVPIYRFYNTSTGTHFYTGSEAEKQNIEENLPALNYEGVAYYGYLDGGTPLYRYYNTSTGTHFYTASESEKQNVDNNLPQFSYEGIAYYVDL